jgi:hypothetical protein
MTKAKINLKKVRVSKDKRYVLFWKIVYSRKDHEACIYRPDCPKEEYGPVSINGAIECVKCILSCISGFEHWTRLDFEKYVLSVIDQSDPLSRKKFVELLRVEHDTVEDRYIVPNPEIRGKEYGEIPLNRVVGIGEFSMTCEGDGWNERHQR